MDVFSPGAFWGVKNEVKNFGYFDADEKDCVEEHTVYTHSQYREICQRQPRASMAETRSAQGSE